MEGVGDNEDVMEAHSKFLRYDVVMAKADKTNMVTKSTSRSAEKHTKPSNNGVYELLECPMCTNLMYPPIHQVCLILYLRILMFF